MFTYNVHFHSIRIDDILVPATLGNLGVGSYLLARLDELAEELGVSSVHGWLSPRDADRHRQLRRFYLKAGYAVQFHVSNSGSIVKRFPVPVLPSNDTSE